MTTQIITPEVRAALEKFRAYASTENGYWCAEIKDAQGTLAYAMLSLFPPGMPEPVEMWACGESEHIYNASTTRCDCDAIRGLFIPLERLEQ